MQLITDTLIKLFIAALCAIIVVFVHEMPKAFVNYYLTHPLYRRKANLSLNPFKFVDPIGFITFLFMKIGWQKPIEINANRYKDRSKGLISVALAGILSNLLLMSILVPIFYAIPNTINSSDFTSYLRMFLSYLIYFNFSITVINLLPIPPFDMTKLIYAFSPNTYFKLIQYERIIQAIFILVFVIGIIPAMIQGLFLFIIW